MFVFFTGSAQLHANEYFDLADGRTLKNGMTRTEVISLIGKPTFREVESSALTVNHNLGASTVETWSYFLDKSVGGRHLVSITLEQGVVVGVNWQKRVQR